MKREQVNTRLKVRNKVGLLAGTDNCPSISLNMYFCTRVLEALEAHPASGDDRNWVEFVVYPREIRHPSVKERSPNRIPNTWGPKRDSSDGRAQGQIKRHK